jgi:hypothetical protein
MFSKSIKQPTDYFSFNNWRNSSRALFGMLDYPPLFPIDLFWLIFFKKFISSCISFSSCLGSRYVIMYQFFQDGGSGYIPSLAPDRDITWKFLEFRIYFLRIVYKRFTFLLFVTFSSVIG